MKAKADAMLKKGLISEKQHAKMLASVNPKGNLGTAGVAKSKDAGWTTAEIVPNKSAAVEDLDPKSGNPIPKMTGKDTEKTDDPSGKFRKRGSDKDDVGEKVSKDD
jgi:hypothetical protein